MSFLSGCDHKFGLLGKQTNKHQQQQTCKKKSGHSPHYVLFFFSLKIRLTFSPFFFSDFFPQLFNGFLSQNVVADKSSNELSMACRQNRLSRVREILDNSPGLVGNFKS